MQGGEAATNTDARSLARWCRILVYDLEMAILQSKKAQN